MKLLDEVETLSEDYFALREYITQRANRIVSKTQGDSWDDPQDIEMDGVELAHAVVKFFKILERVRVDAEFLRELNLQ